MSLIRAHTSAKAQQSRFNSIKPNPIFNKTYFNPLEPDLYLKPRQIVLTHRYHFFLKFILFIFFIMVRRFISRR